MTNDLVAAVLADPPLVHPAAPNGVWWTEESCYQYLLDHASQARATLETGLGVSTALFARTGAQHTAVFLDPKEGDRFRDWAESH